MNRFVRVKPLLVTYLLLEFISEKKEVTRAEVEKCVKGHGDAKEMILLLVNDQYVMWFKQKLVMTRKGRKLYQLLCDLWALGCV